MRGHGHHDHFEHHDHHGPPHGGFHDHGPPHGGFHVHIGGGPGFSPMPPPPMYNPPPVYVPPPIYQQPMYPQPAYPPTTMYVQQASYVPQPAYPPAPGYGPTYGPTYSVSMRPMMTGPLMSRPANLMGIAGCFKCQGMGWYKGKPCKRCVRLTHPGVCLFCRGTGWNYKHNMPCHACHAAGRVYFF